MCLMLMNMVLIICIWRLKKKTNLLHERFGGPDVYSTIDYLAAEISKLSNTLQSSSLNHLFRPVLLLTGRCAVCERALGGNKFTMFSLLTLVVVRRDSTIIVVPRWTTQQPTSKTNKQTNKQTMIDSSLSLCVCLALHVCTYIVLTQSQWLTPPILYCPPTWPVGARFAHVRWGKLSLLCFSWSPYRCSQGQVVNDSARRWKFLALYMTAGCLRVPHHIVNTPSTN